MAGVVETTLRGPEAYGLARRAIEAMEAHKIWPTPLNFELWTHYIGDPDGALGQEIERILDSGEVFSDQVSEDLAAAYLPKVRLNEQIRDAGDQLSRQLATVTRAITTAQKSNEAYGATLADATKGLVGDKAPTSVAQIVETLSVATRKVQKENRSLEKRLKDSTTEVSRLKEHLEQVRREATTDALTSLANRKAFDEELDRAVGEADESSQPMTLAVIDIDHFKGFNDTWGHQTGDQVIRYVASVIGRMAALPRFAARYGGEEFGVIFPSEGAAIVEQSLEEIREEIASRMLKRRSTNEDLGAVTVSAGLAQREPGETAHALMERADAALYASKRSGRNRVTTAGPTKAVEAA
jgi:diguanylate cyclase